jgi:hypothetical protein
MKWVLLMILCSGDCASGVPGWQYFDTKESCEQFKIDWQQAEAEISDKALRSGIARSRMRFANCEEVTGEVNR